MINPIKNNKYIGTSHAARKGIQGLASGLDIPELVKGMTLGTRSKIAKFKQSQTLIGWKMDAYRGITKNLRSFNDKFLSSTSNSFLRSKESFSKQEKSHNNCYNHCKRDKSHSNSKPYSHREEKKHYFPCGTGCAASGWTSG